MKKVDWQTARFASAMAGYRIIRLGVELSILPRMTQLGYSAGLAGNVFLLYSVFSMVAGLFFLLYPSACFGKTHAQTWALELVSILLMCLGFAGMVNVTQLWAIYMCGVCAGLGSAAWNINYQAMCAVSFPEEKMHKLALYRQLFESVGFLLPAVILAIPKSSGGNGNPIGVTAIVLALAAFLFHLLSSSRLVNAAVSMSDASVSKSVLTFRDVLKAIKDFFMTSIVALFLVTSIMLASSNLIMGTLSVITRDYFGLQDEQDLWVGALGFPLGGIVSVPISSKFLMGKFNIKNLAMRGMQAMISFFAVLIAISPLLPVNSKSTGMVSLFLFGFFGGFIYCQTYTSSLTMWLRKLKSYPVAFNSQAAVINNLGVQAIIAIVFQLQTILIHSAGIEDGQKPSWVAAMVIFLPIMFILSLALGVTWKFIPYPPDKFGWPGETSFSFMFKIIMSLLHGLGWVNKADLVFVKFQTIRTSWLGCHLIDSKVQRGPVVKESAELTPEDFESYLSDFDRQCTSEEWWQTKNVKLHSILIKNEEALDARLDVLNSASSSIYYMTWCFNESIAANKIADILISKARKGVNVKVIVDEVTLYLHMQESMLGKSEKNKALKRLLDASRVDVRMLSKRHDGEKVEYIVGSHRKLLLVDECQLLVGGRNTTDSYFNTDTSHFQDSEFLLEGCFSHSTSVLFHKLWNEAQKLDHFIPPSDKSNPQDVVVQIEEEKMESLPVLPTNSARTLLDGCNHVTAFQLDHKGGDTAGYDIIFLSLLFLIDTAETSIDLVFGYFQLFEELDVSLTKAFERGVKIRLMTNSSTTNGMSYMNGNFASALKRLLVIGAEIYTTRDDVGKEFSLHHKLVIADGKAALIGSWNCIGTSVFYDSDFSVLVFLANGLDSSVFDPSLHELIIAGQLVRITEVTGFDIPLIYRLPIHERVTKQLMKRGY